MTRADGSLRPATHVRSESGHTIQRQLFKELLQKLEEIQPGVTAALEDAAVKSK